MGFYSEKLFPLLVEKSLDNPEIHARRAALCGPASGDVLEIGFGTGATLNHYDRDRVASLAVVEPSPGMNRRAKRRIEASGWTIRVAALAGENLPFADESFDYVVSCLTLCSVGDPRRVLGEIKRVLRPGGRFRFFEHVLSEDPARARWQNRLNPVQRIIGVGCNLNRDTVSLVRQEGFEMGGVAQEIEPAWRPFANYLPVVAAEARKPG